MFPTSFQYVDTFFVVFLKVSLISTGSTGRWQSWMPNETACTSGKGLVDSQLGAMGNPPDVGRQWDDGNQCSIFALFDEIVGILYYNIYNIIYIYTIYIYIIIYI